MQQFNCTIGIDIGTTSVKVLAFSEDGRLITQDSCRLELIQTEDGGAEQDVRAVYSSVMSVLAQVMKDVTATGGRVRQVGFSAAMHSILAVDDAGEPLTHAITWMDVRANEQSTQLWASKEGPSLYSRTGTPVHPMSPVVKLMWLSKSQSDLVANAYKFVSIKEWIWYQWFGEWVVDVSMANATGLYHFEQQTWDETALLLAGIREDQLGKIVPTTYTKATVTDQHLLEMGIQQDTVFNVGSTDGVLANLGSGAVGPESLVLTIGTSCAVRVTASKPMTDPDIRSFCYELDPSRYILGGPSNSGGIAVESLYRNMLAGEQHGVDSEGMRKLLEEAAEVDTGDLLCLPYVAGERAPLWAANAKAAWIGMGLEHTRIHLLKSVVEGVLLNAYWIASSLIKLVGAPQSIIASGRLLEVDWICQATADIFGLPVHYSTEGDTSAIGAVWLAEIANGVRDWNSIQHNNHGMKVFTPDSTKHDMYQKKFTQFTRYARSMQPQNS